MLIRTYSLIHSMSVINYLLSVCFVSGLVLINKIRAANRMYTSINKQKLYVINAIREIE